MSEEFKQDKKRMQKMMEGGKKNADNIGIGAAVVLSWLATTYLGVPVPETVISALSVMIGGFSARIKDRL